MTVDCVPSSPDVRGRAVTIFIPEIEKILVLLVVNVPANLDPSDIVTLRSRNQGAGGHIVRCRRACGR